MGGCVSSINIGEDYIVTIMTNLKANKLTNKDLLTWVESNKKEIIYKEAKDLIEHSTQEIKLMKEETIILLEDYNSTKSFIVLDSMDNFKSMLCYCEENNRHLEIQFHILRKLFFKQFEFNCYHFLLTMLSFLHDRKKEKISIFFEICTKIKKNFTYEDFKLFLYSYLYNNLYTTSNYALVIMSSDNILRTELDHLVSNYFTDVNIKKYEDYILEKVNIVIINSAMTHIMKNEEFLDIFFDKEYIFNFKELRKDYMNFHK